MARSATWQVGARHMQIDAGLATTTVLLLRLRGSLLCRIPPVQQGPFLRLYTLNPLPSLLLPSIDHQSSLLTAHITTSNSVTIANSRKSTHQ